MNHDTTTRNGTEYPTPGDWSLNWVEGDVVSWRHGDDGSRVFDGPTAHAFVSYEDMGIVAEVRVDVNGKTVETFEPTDRDAAFDRIGDLLAEHEPE